MARVMNWIYGLALIYLALDGFILKVLPENYLPVAVIIVGALILFTPIGSLRARPTISAKIRRFVFGAAVVLMGVASTGILGEFNILGSLTINSFYGQLILLIIGVIYLFAGTKRGDQPIYSA